MLLLYTIFSWKIILQSKFLIDIEGNFKTITGYFILEGFLYQSNFFQSRFFRKVNSDFLKIYWIIKNTFLWEKMSTKIRKAE